MSSRPPSPGRGIAGSLARRHLGPLLAVAFAVFGGTVMITAAAILAETSLTASVPPDRLAGADIVVSAPQKVVVVEEFDLPLPERATVPTSLSDQVAAVDGVAAVAADVTIAVTVQDHVTTAHNWDVAALADAPLRGTVPRTDRDVVVDQGLASAAGLDLGDSVEVAVGGETHQLRIRGIIDAPGDGLHLEATTAADLAGLPDNTTDLLAVTVDQGVDIAHVEESIADVVGDDYVLSTGDARGDVESLEVGVARSELLELGGSLAGTLLLLVGCITAGALAVSIANQRRDLALLRAVGATPRQIRRLVATQASWAALAGVVPGIAVGYPLAHRLVGSMAEAGMVTTPLPIGTTPYAALVVAAVTMLVVQLAARAASLGASRRSAREALAEAEVEPRQPSRIRTAAGVVLIAVALGQSVLPLFLRGEAAFLSAVSGTLVAIVGLALAGPALARAATDWWARRVDDRAAVPTWLAVNNTRSSALRTSGAVTVLALAIGLTITQFYAQSTLARVTDHELTHGMVADTAITGQVTSADLAELAATPDVKAAVPMVSTTVLRRSGTRDAPTAESYKALGLGEGAQRVVDLDVRDGDLAKLSGASVALEATTARSWNAGVGDHVDLILGNGERVSPKVVATYRRGFGFGSAIVATNLLQAHGAGRDTDAILVAGDQRAIADWAATRPHVEVDPTTALGDDGAASLERWINLLVLLPMLGYVLVAAANSLMATTLRRRGEISTLRVIGTTPRQIMAMVTREALALSALAVVAGAALSLLPMSLLGLGFLGRPWPQGPLWVAPAIAAVVVVLTIGVMRSAARRLLARSPLP